MGSMYMFRELRGVQYMGDEVVGVENHCGKGSLESSLES